MKEKNNIHLNIPINRNLLKKINILKTIILLVSLAIYFYLTFASINQYIFNMTYTKCISYILLIFLFLYTFGILEHKEKIYQTNINMYIILYFILLISVTFFIGRTRIQFYNWWYGGQYQPFHTITSQLKYGSHLSILKNVIGNSVMLMPFSFLLMLKNKKYHNIFHQMLIILPTIIGIEVFQAFTHTGSFDIDDILLNYFGTVLFTFIITRFSMMEKLKKLFYTDYKLNAFLKHILFYFATFLLIIYIIALYLKMF